MKYIIYWILSILLIVLCVINSSSFTETVLNDSQIDRLEIEYNLNFSDNEWNITEYKQNNLLGDKKIIIEAKNFQVDTILTSATKYVSMTISKEKSEVPWANDYEKVMIQENLNIDQLVGKVEVIYSNTNKIDEDSYNPIYRFSFLYSDMNYIIEFNNGSGEHEIYNIDEKEIHQEELQAYIEYISGMLKL